MLASGTDALTEKRGELKAPDDYAHGATGRIAKLN